MQYEVKLLNPSHRTLWVLQVYEKKFTDRCKLLEAGRDFWENSLLFADSPSLSMASAVGVCQGKYTGRV